MNLNLALFRWLTTICQDILEEIEFADGKKHTFNFECHEEGSLVEMDEKLLRKMLINLLSNATKYSSQEGTVQLNVFCGNKQAVYTIRDEGIGIPEAEKERLFEVLHRASNVGNISGTALGMSIIKQAVELHGGASSLRVKWVWEQLLLFVFQPVKSRMKLDEK